MNDQAASARGGGAGGRRRAHLAQSRSRETRRAILRAAIDLWVAKGYAETTVADICQAAGVSKALFFFYFPRKEDALLESGFLSVGDAQQTWRDLVERPYEVPDVIVAVLAVLERAMRRTPPALLVESVLEGHRAEQRALAEGRSEEHHTSRFVLLGFLQHAQADGKLPADADVQHLARSAQTLLEAGVRHWAVGEYGDRSFAEVVGGDITALLRGYGQIPT